MHAAPSFLLVTRPQPQADAWVDQLQRHGVQALALPLISTTPPENPSAVHALWHTLHTVRLVMFVSPAAVQHFFDVRPPGLSWPAHTLAAAPGPGTASQLLLLGAPAGLHTAQVLSPAADAEQFDSEHLWPVMQHLAWAGQQVVIASGGQGEQARGRQWLAQRWRDHGATVRALVCYQRGAASWSAAERALAVTALHQPDHHLWMFSASEAIDLLLRHHLPRLSDELPQPAHTLSHLQALCTHPRVAHQAQQAGVSRCWTCKPTLPAVLAQWRIIQAGGPTPDTIVSP